MGRFLENLNNFRGEDKKWIVYKEKGVVSYHFTFYVAQAFLVGNTFISNARLKLTKNQSNAKQHPEVELFKLFATLGSKNNRAYSNQ